MLLLWLENYRILNLIMYNIYFFKRKMCVFNYQQVEIYSFYFNYFFNVFMFKVIFIILKTFSHIY